MKEKELFIKALSGLFFDWGGDTPPEVFWGANDLLEWYEKEYGVVIGVRFNNEENPNFDEVVEAIRKS